MSMDLSVKHFRHEEAYFEAGTYPIAKAVKEAGADLEAHAPVALADGKLVAVTADNKADVYGIVPEAAEKGEEAVVYLTGEFFADSLALSEGVTASDIETALRKINIFLK
jgi:hypothetical protein